MGRKGSESKRIKKQKVPLSTRSSITEKPSARYWNKHQQRNNIGSKIQSRKQFHKESGKEEQQQTRTRIKLSVKAISTARVIVIILCLL